MSWTHIITDPASVSPGGQASVDLLQNARAVADDTLSRGNLVKRILGDVYICPGDASSTTEGVMGIVRQEAQASGSAFPAFDTLARWLYWKRFVIGTEATGELGTGMYKAFSLDLKMNYKIWNRADELNLVLDNDDGTHVFVFSLGLRLLIAK